MTQSPGSEAGTEAPGELCGVIDPEWSPRSELSTPDRLLSSLDNCYSLLRRWGTIAVQQSFWHFDDKAVSRPPAWPKRTRNLHRTGQLGHIGSWIARLPFALSACHLLVWSTCYSTVGLEEEGAWRGAAPGSRGF